MRRTKFLKACALVVLGSCFFVSPSHAQESNATAETPPATPAPQAACQGEEYRQLDFWVGDWDLSWTNADGTKGTGRNVITRSDFGDCVITENFDGSPSMALKGLSVSTYSRPHQLWRQTWVDSQGGYFSLYGGPQEDKTFVLTMERLNDNGPHSRMVFEDITKEGLVWRWQGKRAEIDEWVDQWVITYKRRSS